MRTELSGSEVHGRPCLSCAPTRSKPASAPRRHDDMVSEGVLNLHAHLHDTLVKTFHDPKARTEAAVKQERPVRESEQILQQYTIFWQPMWRATTTPRRESLSRDPPNKVGYQLFGTTAARSPITICVTT